MGKVSIKALKVIDKYKGVRPATAMVCDFVVEQRMNGVLKKLSKELPLMGPLAGILDPATKRGKRDIDKMMGLDLGKTFLGYNAGKTVAVQAVQKRNRQLRGAVTQIVDLWGEVESMDSNVVRLSAERLTPPARDILKLALLEASVDYIIDNNSHQEGELRPFLDFNYELSKPTFKKIEKACGLNTKQWAEILGVPESRIESSRKFNHQQSMHILKVLLLSNHGKEVFNGKTSFKNWLKKKNSELGGTPPYFYLDSPAGVELVRKRLDRIEHGIFS